jgi:protein-L-isoaspartate(D-aspartate) O-methyltransferase
VTDPSIHAPADLSGAAASAGLRAALVARLVESGVLHGEAVRRAFTAVPRELFVPALAAVRGLEAIYADDALVTRERHGQPASSSSQPSIMALMLDALDLRTGQRVLEVGLGTGYNAALLARLVGPTGRVTGIDVDAGVASDATAALRAGGFPVLTLVGDGRLGHPDGAPYDRIIVTASATSVPRAWWQQLTPDGRLVVPIRIGALQLVAVLDRTSTGFSSSHLIRGGFMSLRAADDDGRVDADEQPTLGMRRVVPGSPSSNISLQGVAVAELTPPALGNLAANLLRPPVREEIDRLPAVPPIWHVIMTTDLRRQVSIFGLPGGLRYGIVDLHSGAFAVLVAEPGGADLAIAAIESYGPAQSCADELRHAVAEWVRAGSPPLERLSLTVRYEVAGSDDAAPSITHADQTVALRWTPGASWPA